MSRVRSAYVVVIGIVLVRMFLAGAFAQAQTCSVDAPAGAMTGAEHTIPDQFLPMVGATIFVGTTPKDQTQGQVRVVAYSVFPNPLMKEVNRTFVPSNRPGLSGTWVVSIAPAGGPPPRTVPDGWDMIGAYDPHKLFKYRLEFCDGGNWVPITAQETNHTFAFSQKYLDDVYTVTYGSKQDHPTAQNILTTVIFAMNPKLLEVHVDVELGCKGIPGLAAYSSDTVHGYIKDHFTGQPVNVKNIGASMIFDGSTNITPQAGHGSLNFPGSGDPFNPGQGYVDKFPYSQVSKSANDTSSVEVDDKSFGIAIGGPCRPFNGVVRAIMYDGQVVTSVQHTP